MFQRFRIRLAIWLTRGTPCAITRLAPLVSLNNVAVRLREYVEKSGGLADPRRINAYRTILRAATDLSTAASTLLVDTQRVRPTSLSAARAAQKEEQDAARQSKAEAQSV